MFAGISRAHAIALAGVAVDTYIIHRQQKKIDRLRQDQDTLVKVIGFQRAQIEYLSDMLDRNGIVPTEFDVIALQNPTIVSR